MRKYQELMQEILDDGIQKENRTGIDTISIFGTRIKLNLQDGFPILTTKRVFWRGVVEELLFFLRGETDTKKLEDKGIGIWKNNTSRKFLHANGLLYPEGEMGPGYGFQWRNFGGRYTTLVWNDDSGHRIISREIDKGFDGVDQLQQVVDRIQSHPDCRRHIVSAWNPQQLPQMALPPCHLLYQFYVNDSKLSCQWYQRSVDVPLGLPFNIASYALLTHIIAAICGLDVGNLIFIGGDTHIYENQLNGVREQLSREPEPLPTLGISRKIRSLKDAEKLRFEDFELLDYVSHTKIDCPFAT